MIINITDLTEFLTYNTGNLAEIWHQLVLQLPSNLQIAAWEAEWELSIQFSINATKRYDCWIEIRPITNQPLLLEQWLKQYHRVLLQLHN
jgi:hypothetical protein